MGELSSEDLVRAAVRHWVAEAGLSDNVTKYAEDEAVAALMKLPESVARAQAASVLGAHTTERTA